MNLKCFAIATVLSLKLIVVSKFQSHIPHFSYKEMFFSWVQMVVPLEVFVLKCVVNMKKNGEAQVQNFVAVDVFYLRIRYIFSPLAVEFMVIADGILAMVYSNFFLKFLQQPK